MTPSGLLYFAKGPTLSISLRGRNKDVKDNINDYRDTERIKIECALRHFAIISDSIVTYDVVKTYNELRDMPQCDFFKLFTFQMGGYL